MFFKSSRKAQSRIDTLIGADTVLEGDVEFGGGLRVDGAINGNVSERGAKAGTFVLSERGRVEGAISVSHAMINGTVVGPLRVSEFVELQPKARVMGDVCYKTLEIHLGAVVDGKLIHMNEATPPAGEED